MGLPADEATAVDQAHQAAVVTPADARIQVARVTQGGKVTRVGGVTRVDRRTPDAVTRLDVVTQAAKLTQVDVVTQAGKSIHADAVTRVARLTQADVVTTEDKPMAAVTTAEEAILTGAATTEDMALVARFMPADAFSMGDITIRAADPTMARAVTIAAVSSTLGFMTTRTCMTPAITTPIRVIAIPLVTMTSGVTGVPIPVAMSTRVSDTPILT